MRENWRWDSTATASSSQPDISLFWLLLLILLQLLRIRICLVEHLLLSKSSFFPETILFLFTIYVIVTQYHLTSWGRGFEGPVSQLQTWQDHISLQAWQKTTCDVTMQCAPKGGGEMTLTILEAQYYLKHVSSWKSDGQQSYIKLEIRWKVGKNFFSAEFNCSDHREITIFSTDTIQNAHSLGKWDNTTADIILWTLYIRTFIAKSLMSSKQDSFFSCPEQLNRWPCHSLTDWATESLTFTFDITEWP